MQSDKELDRILNSALPGYCEPREEDRPRPGLENRIIALAFAETRSRRGFRTRWWIAAPTFACLLLAGLFLYARFRAKPVSGLSASLTPLVKQSTLPIAGSPDVPATEKASPRSSPPPVRSQRKTGHAEELPKQDTFPSPMPLSPQERALLAWSHEPTTFTPETANPRELEPIHIAALHIQPIAVADESLNPEESHHP